MLVDFEKTESPFQHSATRILRPSLNNERIVAQSGWFTAHKFSKAGKRFIPLEKNRKMKDLIIKIIIPAEKKEEILKSLAVFGVNNRTVFPYIFGLCEHTNWIYNNKIEQRQ